MRSATTDPLVAELERMSTRGEWPETVWLADLGGNEFVAWAVRPGTDKMRGLACFRTEGHVVKYLDHLTQGGTPVSMPFAEALGIGVSKKPKVNCLLLLGVDLDNPEEVHWL